jgi:hypothetical protein
MDIQAPDLSPVDRDQAAIRALSGDYRVTFDFLETVVMGSEGKPSTPYRSWGTERVYVAEERPGFVSLQHIMVMFIIDQEGQEQGPFVMKHWRQDWTWQAESYLTYVGLGQFERVSWTEEERAGVWVQEVSQVDDAPRYALRGRWTHDATHSSWQSESGWRPLPRREHSVRDDYDVLAGTNRLTVLPTGWVHEQDNLKTVLTDDGEIDASEPVRAREMGLSRYDRLEGFAFDAGDVYWEKTGAFWALVRDKWRDAAAGVSTLDVKSSCEDDPRFALLFDLAARVESGEDVPIGAELEKIFACVLPGPPDPVAPDPVAPEE